MIRSIKIYTILMLSLMMFSSGNNIIAQDKIKSVKIGSQIWMVENLNVSTFRNGDSIPEMKTKEEWIKTGKEGKPAWCYYDNDPENGKTYGKLYNWFAVNDKRGLTPKGWHIPTSAEFQKLFTAVDNHSNALKAKGEGSGRGVGTNKSGFSALFAGYRYSFTYFYSLGYYTYFWSSTKYDTTSAYGLYLGFNNNNIYFYENNKEFGLSVRCIKD